MVIYGVSFYLEIRVVSDDRVDWLGLGFRLRFRFWLRFRLGLWLLNGWRLVVGLLLILVVQRDDDRGTC